MKPSKKIQQIIDQEIDMRLLRISVAELGKEVLRDLSLGFDIVQGEKCVCNHGGGTARASEVVGCEDLDL